MVGVIAGFIVGALAADAEMLGISDHWNWRRAIFTQGIALFIFGIILIFFPNDQIDILADMKRKQKIFDKQLEHNKQNEDNIKIEEEPVEFEIDKQGLSERRAKRQLAQNEEFYSEKEGMCQGVIELFTNSVYMLTMLTVSSIYFSSTGIQFWTIFYL